MLNEVTCAQDQVRPMPLPRLTRRRCRWAVAAAGRYVHKSPLYRAFIYALYLLPLEPLVGAVLVVQLYPARKATASSPWRQLGPNTREN
jgi:hypothetical protein